jgi:hypothetical protein
LMLTELAALCSRRCAVGWAFCVLDHMRNVLAECCVQRLFTADRRGCSMVDPACA